MNDIEKAIEQLDIQIKSTVNTVSIESCKLAIEALKKQLNNGWIPCSERLPDEKENPITWDYYEYTVTIYICGKYDIRHYKFGRGKWWNGGADMSSIVIAWQPLPSPYEVTNEN